MLDYTTISHCSPGPITQWMFSCWTRAPKEPQEKMREEVPGPREPREPQEQENRGTVISLADPPRSSRNHLSRAEARRLLRLGFHQQEPTELDWTTTHTTTERHDIYTQNYGHMEKQETEFGHRNQKRKSETECRKLHSWLGKNCAA